jgi:hypothetical protein
MSYWDVNMKVKIEITAESLGVKDVAVYKNEVECTRKQLDRLINGIAVTIGHALEIDKKRETEEDM